MDSMFLCYISLNVKVIWFKIVSAPPPVNLKVCQAFSLKTVNTQESEMFLLRTSSGNVNASVVTCRYPQVYNFCFRKEFLEIVFI